jgi:hypothetical protein
MQRTLIEWVIAAHGAWGEVKRLDWHLFEIVVNPACKSKGVSPRS